MRASRRVRRTAHRAADKTMPPASATTDETRAIYRLKPTDAAKSERVSASAQYSKVKSAMPINGMMPKPWSTPFTTP